MADHVEGWDIRSADEQDWMPWGADGKAEAKILGAADGYTLTLVRAQRGYRGTEHEHHYTEMLYVVDGELRNQGATMRAGDGYAASAGSRHTDFEALTDATYVIAFKLTEV